MASGKLLPELFTRFLSVEENKSRSLGKLKKILIVRQHNQLGDMLATVSFFRALKEKFPRAEITLITSPANYPAVTKNRLIDRVFVYNKKKLFNPLYFFSLLRLLRKQYDAVFVPVTVSISFTSNLLARISKSRSRIGVGELNGVKNEYASFFDRPVVMDWRIHPDQNVSDFCLEMLRHFGISTNDYSSLISFDKTDHAVASKFIKEEIKPTRQQRIIGLHIGAGKPPNRWPLDKYAELIEKLKSSFNPAFYLTGSTADNNELDYLQQQLGGTRLPVFQDRSIPQVAALIAVSDLFITNDTGIMHVAGATSTPQVSIFGPTNPYNWAPVGEKKEFIWKSDIIGDIQVEEVYNACLRLAGDKLKMAGNA